LVVSLTASSSEQIVLDSAAHILNEAGERKTHLGFADALRGALRPHSREQLKPGTLRRFEVPVPPTDILGWLSIYQARPRFYWKSRDGASAAGAVAEAGFVAPESEEDLAGQTRRLLDRLRGSPEGGRARLYLAAPFSFGPEHHWAGLPPALLLLPSLELLRERRGYRLACNLLAPARRSATVAELAGPILAALSRGGQQPDTATVHLCGPRRDTPSAEQWQNLVHRALESIEQGDLEKLVLSRETLLPTRQAASPWELLRHWQRAEPHSFAFAVTGGGSSCFLGCSPELLLRNRAGRVSAEALAGTAARPADSAQAARLAAALLADGKIRREHDIVVNHISAAMDNLCEAVERDHGPRVVCMARVQHLRTLVHGRLRSGRDAVDLMRLLHPTPAVGGHPAGAARQWLRQTEPHRRGYYSGVVGWLGLGSAELAVAIRSACVSPEAVRLYAGAGLVRGSKPQPEWQELEEKVALQLGLMRQLTPD
jgi:menaquinone-specific isochorismate synthase